MYTPQMLKDIRSFVDATAHKFLTDGKATSVVPSALKSNVDLICIFYPDAIEHSWPRDFKFHYEFMALDAEPMDLVPKLAQHLPSETSEYTLNLFAAADEERINRYQNAGFQFCWLNHIMARPITSRDETSGTVPPAHTILIAQNEQDVERINRLSNYETTEAAVADEHILDLYICENDHAIAAAQVVMLPNMSAYIGGMHTDKAHRQRGCCTCLMQAIHKTLQDRGITRCTLVPSQMTMEFNLYQRYGYVDSVPMMMLITMR